MARKRYEPPKIINVDPSEPGTDPIGGSAQTPYPKDASYSAWRMAVQNANLDIGLDYSDYVRGRSENGYGAYIQPDDSELQ